MGTVLAMDAAGQMSDGVNPQLCSGMSREQQAIFTEVLTALEEGSLDLPTLPDMARKIQDLIDDPNVSADQVVNLLASDPVVSMYIIRAANSAALSNGNPASNLRTAISRLGYRMLRSMVMNITMTRLFQASSPLINQQLMKLWGHSREVAANCYVLARQQKHLKPEEAMLAGLVHDIGALPLYLHFDRHHPRFDLAALEELVCKLSTPIGARLLHSWNFPDELIDAATGHENLQRMNHSGVPDYADVVTMANLLHGAAAKFVAWKNVLAAERLGYYAGDCQNFLSNHAEELAAAREMLGVNASRH